MFTETLSVMLVAITQTYGGNSNGEPCVLPFTYNAAGDFLLLHDRRAAGWTPLVQHNFQLWARPEIYSFCTDHTGEYPRGVIMRKTLSCSVFIEGKLGVLLLPHFESTTFVSSDPGTWGLTSQLKILSSFPVVLEMTPKEKPSGAFIFNTLGSLCD